MSKSSIIAILGMALFLSACSNLCKPKSDCLDVPCVPCIFPFPLTPVQANAGESSNIAVP